MLVVFLIEQLIAKLQVTPNMALAYHFCDNRNRSSNNATAVVRQLLFQLFQQHPEHFHFLQTPYNVQGNKLFQDFDALWDIFVAVLEASTSNNSYSVIDALDECDEKSRYLIARGFKEIGNRSVNVRIFFTCRPEEDIERLCRQGPIKVLPLATAGSDVQEDLKKYLGQEVPALVEMKGWGAKEEELITETLLRKSNGTFLWVAFVMDDLWGTKTKSDIPRTLDTLPRDLSEVYRQITDDYDPAVRDQARIILKLLLSAKRPLRVHELALAYVLVDSSPHRWPSETMPSKEKLASFDDIYLCCGKLLRYNAKTRTIDLIHQSAKMYVINEYLDQKGHEGDFN